MLPLVNVLWPNSLAHSWMQATMIAIEQPSCAGAIPETLGFGSRISASCALSLQWVQRVADATFVESATDRTILDNVARTPSRLLLQSLPRPGYYAQRERL